MSVKELPKKKPGFLAVCDACEFQSSNLTKCANCDALFGADVKLVPETAILVTLNDGKDQSGGIKKEIKSDARAEEMPDSERFKEEELVVEEVEIETVSAPPPPPPMTEAKAKMPKNEDVYEKRLRVIHSYRQIKQKSMIVHISDQPEDKTVNLHSQAHSDDTVIEEGWCNDQPISVRFIKLSVLGMKTALLDEGYRKYLNRIVFGCSSSLKFKLDFLNHAQNATSVRFGNHAFSVQEQDKQEFVASPVLRIKENRHLKSLEMSYDRDHYLNCSPVQRRMIKISISEMLAIAPTAFPKLEECDFLIPEDVESSLEDFLSKRPEIKSNGCTKKSYKDKSIRFCTTHGDTFRDGRSQNGAKGKTAKEQSGNHSLSVDSEAASSKNDSTEVLTIDLSSEEDEIDSSVITCSSMKKCGYAKKEEIRPSPQNECLDWANDERSKNITPGEVVFSCPRCKVLSSNLTQCTACRFLFTLDTKATASLTNSGSSKAYETNKRKRQHDENMVAYSIDDQKIFKIGVGTKCPTCGSFSKKSLQCSHCRTKLPVSTKEKCNASDTKKKGTDNKIIELPVIENAVDTDKVNAEITCTSNTEYEMLNSEHSGEEVEIVLEQTLKEYTPEEVIEAADRITRNPHSVQDGFVVLNCRCIRIGTYIPDTPSSIKNYYKVVFSSYGISFTLPDAKNKHRWIKCGIPHGCLENVSISFRRPYSFVCVTRTKKYAEWIRKKLNLGSKSIDHDFYCPDRGENEPQRNILFMIDSFTEEDIATVRQIYSTRMIEADNAQANELLMKLSPLKRISDPKKKA